MVRSCPSRSQLILGLHTFATWRSLPSLYWHVGMQEGGPCITIPSLVKEIFFLFFTSSVLDIMVQETNRYASTCLGDRSESWTAVTTNELCAYMGCMILMGFIKLPSLHDYWKKDRVFWYPPIADVISQDLFLAIYRYLHFTNNETLSTPGSVDHDKLGKIRPIITALSEWFAAAPDTHRLTTACINTQTRGDRQRCMRDSPCFTIFSLIALVKTPSRHKIMIHKLAWRCLCRFHGTASLPIAKGSMKT